MNYGSLTTGSQHLFVGTGRAAKEELDHLCGSEIPPRDLEVSPLSPLIPALKGVLLSFPRADHAEDLLPRNGNSPVTSFIRSDLVASLVTTWAVLAKEDTPLPLRQLPSRTQRVLGLNQRPKQHALSTPWSPPRGHLVLGRARGAGALRSGWEKGRNQGESAPRGCPSRNPSPGPSSPFIMAPASAGAGHHRASAFL